MSNVKVAYAASAALTITLASLASDSNLLAGRQSTLIDNTSNLYLDYLLAGKVMTGTTPTVTTQIEVWAFAILNDAPLYPDAFGATDASVSATSRNVLFQYARRAAVMVVSASSNVAYSFGPVSVLALFGQMPQKFGVWVVHNTTVNLNATGGNHVISVTPVFATVT